MRKVIVKAKFVNQYKHAIKGTGIKVSCFVGFFHPVEKDLLIGKKLFQWRGFLTNTQARYKGTGSNVDCYAGVCHHHLVTTSTYTHEYHGHLFENGM